jgi:hypothetical protein
VILYVNGDSHSAAAEAVNPAAFLKDSPNSWKIDFKNVNHPYWMEEYEWSPHPENLEVSYGNLLAKKLGAELHCHARSAASNTRIIRTTKEYLTKFRPDLIIIGWAGWEREEWFNPDDNLYYQVNASGADSVPEKWKDRYKNFITDIDWIKCSQYWHNEVWQFHNELLTLKIPHLFFNCHSTFYWLSFLDDHKEYDWGNHYIEPYTKFNYVDYLSSYNYRTANNLHFGPDGHAKWAEFLLPHLTQLL